MNNRKVFAKFLNITADFQQFHDHRTYDAAYGEKYIIRLPDGTPSRIDTFEAKLAAFRAEEEARQKECSAF